VGERRRWRELYGRSQRPVAEGVIAQIEVPGGRAAALQLETGDSDSVNTVIRRVRQQLATLGQRGSFDYFFNNTGTAL